MAIMKKFVLIFFWFIFLIVLVYYVIIEKHKFWENVPLIFGWMLFVSNLTYNNSEKFYLFLQRIWFNIFNPECIWNLTISYKGNYNRDILKKIESVIFHQNQNIKITKLSNTRKLYRLSTFMFEVFINEEDGDVHFFLNDLEVSYRRSKIIIEKELSTLFEKIKLKIKPDDEYFGLNIEFKGANPYFGFFVRRLNTSNVDSFNVIFKVDNDRVFISKESIKINADSFNRLTALSKNYLTLSSLN